MCQTSTLNPLLQDPLSKLLAPQKASKPTRQSLEYCLQGAPKPLFEFQLTLGVPMSMATSITSKPSTRRRLPRALSSGPHSRPDSGTQLPRPSGARPPRHCHSGAQICSLHGEWLVSWVLGCWLGGVGGRSVWREDVGMESLDTQWQGDIIECSSEATSNRPNGGCPPHSNIYPLQWWSRV